MINKTVILQLCVVWLSLTQGAYVPRGQRSAFIPGPPGPAEGFNAVFKSSPSVPLSPQPHFGPAGFGAFNPGVVALPVTGYPDAGFDLGGLQFQFLLAPLSGHPRFPGFGFDVASAGYPLAVPAPQPYPTAASNDLQQLRTLAAEGLRFDPVPRARPADESVTVGQTHVRPVPQTNDASTQSVTPIATTAPPKGSDEQQPRPHYNQVGTASGTIFGIISSAGHGPQQEPQPIRTGGGDSIATSAPPSPGSDSGTEPVPNLALELRPPPYINVPVSDSSFYSAANVPSPQPSSFSTDPAVASSLPHGDGAFSRPPAFDPSVHESYPTTPRGLGPDAYPTPSVSYTLPSESFRLPAGLTDAHGPKNAPRLPMSPIVVVPEKSYPAEASAPDSSPSPAGAGPDNTVPVLANVYGSSNPVSANTYSESNTIQGSSRSNAFVDGTLYPKLIAGAVFDDSNSIASSPQPPQLHYQPNGTK